MTNCIIASQGGRLCSLTSISVPEGVDAKKVCPGSSLLSLFLFTFIIQVQQFLLDNYGIEVAGGLGQLAGKIWRVGYVGIITHHLQKLIFVLFSIISFFPSSFFHFFILSFFFLLFVHCRLMGYNAKQSNVKLFITALKEATGK